MLKVSIRAHTIALLFILSVLTGCAGTTQPPGLSYTLQGTGPEKVIVLHDWRGDHRNYDDVRPYLDGKAFTFAFVDLRGYCASIHISGAFNEKEAAADTLRVADTLGWQQFHIIGHSMTGMVWQRIAAHTPSPVS